jgi:hypothetical protein
MQIEEYKTTARAPEHAIPDRATANLTGVEAPPTWTRPT